MSKTDFRNCHENNPFQKLIHSHFGVNNFKFFRMLARIATRRLTLSAARANYPAWKIDNSNFKNGKMVNGVWVADVSTAHTLAEVEFDNSAKIGLHRAGLNAKHYEMLFGLTVAGYFVFTLYDWRSEAKQ